MEVVNYDAYSAPEGLTRAEEAWEWFLLHPMPLPRREPRHRHSRAQVREAQRRWRIRRLPFARRIVLRPRAVSERPWEENLREVEAILRWLMSAHCCSCSMCGNRRRWAGEVTLQEKRDADRQRTEEREVLDADGN